MAIGSCKQGGVGLLANPEFEEMTDPKPENPKLGPRQMPHRIAVDHLTSCKVVGSGQAICLSFLDSAGQQRAIEFTFEQAQSILMTLPNVLSKALQLRTGNTTSRYVFSLGRWSIERCDEKCLIATFTTTDGFQVAFAIPFDASRSIGWSLSHEGKSEMERAGLGKPGDQRRSLN